MQQTLNKPKTETMSVSLITENIVLATLLHDEQNSYTEYLSVLSQDDFTGLNKKLFQAIRDIVSTGKTPDIVAVREFCEQKSIGIPASYLAHVTAEFSPVYFITFQHYVERLKEWRARRELHKISLSPGKITDEAVDYYATLTVAENTLSELLDIKIPERNLTSFQEAMQQAKADITSPKEITGLRTFFPELDYHTSGLQPGNLIILAARPSVGKTAYALQIAKNVASEGKRVLFYSFEMSAKDLVKRLYSLSAELSLRELKHDLYALKAAEEKVSRIKTLDIDDRCELTVLDIYASAKKYKERHGELDLVIVDYLQLIKVAKGKHNYNNRNLELSEISRTLKLLANELKVPVICLSQLNRDIEKRNPPIPMLSDLRDSGAIEQDADIVAFLYREKTPENEFGERTNLFLAKHRNGAVVTIKYKFHPESTRFVEK